MQPSLREAALLLSCLPQRYAARVLSRLHGAQARALKQQLQKVSESTLGEQQQVVHQFLREVGSRGKSAARLRFDPAADSLPSFHFLSRLEPSEIARILGQELPRTQAVVLAQLPPTLAAEILAQLNDVRRQEVVQQLAALDGQAITALPELARGLEQIVARRGAAVGHDIVGRQLLARMLAQSQGNCRELLAQTLQRCGLPVADVGPAADESVEA